MSALMTFFSRLFTRSEPTKLTAEACVEAKLLTATGEEATALHELREALAARIFKEDDPALIFAIQSDRYALAHMLIANSESMMTRLSSEEYAALKYAAINGHFEIVRLILRQ